ncbi:MAG: HDIG domain-containing protein [Bacteroidales bacterium]|nr:HDIG domain-containing protein [Bacteroidales bacterium]
MEQPVFFKSKEVLISSLVIALLLTVLMPLGGKFDYRYFKGGTWDYETLIAPFDFPILKTNEQILQEKEKLGSTYVPYFRYDDDVIQTIEADAEGLLPENADIAKAFVSCLRPYYQRGILPESTANLGESADESQAVVFVQRDKRAVKVPRSELYTLKQVRSGALHMLQTEFPDTDIDQLPGRPDLSSLIVPNLTFDRQTTELIHKESADYISPTSGTFKSGNVIVSSGEIITSDIERILDSYKAEFENTIGYNGPHYLHWAGRLLISFLLTFLVVTLVGIVKPTVFRSPNEFIFIISMFFLLAAMSFVSTKLPASLSLIMPYPVIALYFTAFFRNKLALPLYGVCLLPVLVFCNPGAPLYLMYLTAGIVAIYSFRLFNKGWKQFITSLLIFASMILVYFTLRLFNGTLSATEPSDMLFLALSSLISILVYQLVYLFEIIFNLISVSRLVELTDTNNPLLRLLSDKAPGTFQHSIAVMNMAETVGASIDANVPRLRAAALYHDVGKTLNPLCFVENQTAGDTSYHDGLSPKESAREIINHVAAGVELAEKYKIPGVIRDFIACHHGNSVTAFFYDKHIKAGGDPADTADFSYPGPLPHTKEQVILMLCDALEAASRTLKDFSPEAVSAFIHSIHYSKYRDGQYDEADITLHELQVLRDSLNSYIVNMHHSRVKYPKRIIQNNKEK